jgi:hypothetical protein
MKASDSENLPTLVRGGGVWHIAVGGTVVGPQLGEVFLAKCYRWIDARTTRRRGIHRGALRTGEHLCLSCQKATAASATAGVPLDYDGA